MNNVAVAVICTLLMPLWLPVAVLALSVRIGLALAENIHAEF